MGLLHGWDVDGRQFSDQRSLSMTTTAPPADYRWTTAIAASYSNNPPLNPAAHEVWKALRLEYLAQFTLTIIEDKTHRYWFWRDKSQKTHWWERRLLSAPLPTTPGLWPADN